MPRKTQRPHKEMEQGGISREGQILRGKERGHMGDRQMEKHRVREGRDVGIRRMEN